MTRRQTVVHPFLFAIFPILFLFANNRGKVSFDGIFLSTVAIILAVVLVMLLVSRFLFKDTGKAGVAVSVFLILFFSYGHINDSLGDYFIGRQRYLLPMWFVILLCTSVLLKRSRWDFSGLTKTLNVVSAILVVISLINITVSGAGGSHGSAPNVHEETTLPQGLASPVMPDIYYIIMDGYANSRILKETYGYDNSGFENSLRDKGFFIAAESRSNYPMTGLSVPSFLNMKFMNDMSRDTPLSSMMELIINNRISRLLKSVGYSYVYIAPGYLPINNKYATMEFTYSRFLNEFNLTLLNTTMIKVLHNFLWRKQILYGLEKLREVPEIKGPKFVFAYFPNPHPPYVFTRDGSALPLRLQLNGDYVLPWTNKKGYLDQLIYIGGEIDKVVDVIIEKSDPPPIIIIQSDHGPGPTEEWNNPSRRFLKDKMYILNAFLLPKNGKDFLYPSMTPVNSFRLIFNNYFGADFEILEDRSYFSNFDDPYNLTDVTDELTYD